MNDLMESEAFVSGVNVGIRLYQNVVVKAHERKEPLMVEGDFYYLQNGRERLEDVLNKICQ